MTKSRDLADLAGKGVSSTLGSETPVSLGSGTSSNTFVSSQVTSPTFGSGTYPPLAFQTGNYASLTIPGEYYNNVPANFYEVVDASINNGWYINFTNGVDTAQVRVKSAGIDDWQPNTVADAYFEFWGGPNDFPAWLKTAISIPSYFEFNYYESDITYTNPGGHTVPETLTSVRYDGTDYTVTSVTSASSLISAVSASAPPASGDVELVGSNDKFTLTKRDGSTTTEFGFNPDTGHMSSDGDLLLGWQNIPAVGPYANDFTITSFQHGFAPNDFAHEVSLNIPYDGAITAHTADGTHIGGDTRSGSSVDLQTFRTDPTQVAQRPGFVAGGANKLTGITSAAVGGFNTAAGNYSFAAGNTNTVNGGAAAVFGNQNTINSDNNIGLGSYGNDHGTNNTNAVVHGTGQWNVHYMKRVVGGGDEYFGFSISVPDLPDAKLWVTYDVYYFDHTNNTIGVHKDKNFSARRTGAETWALGNGIYPHQLNTQSFTATLGSPQTLPSGSFYTNPFDPFLNFWWTLPVNRYICFVMDIVVSHK